MVGFGVAVIVASKVTDGSAVIVGAVVAVELDSAKGVLVGVI